MVSTRKYLDNLTVLCQLEMLCSTIFFPKGTTCFVIPRNIETNRKIRRGILNTYVTPSLGTHWQTQEIIQRLQGDTFIPNLTFPVLCFGTICTNVFSDNMGFLQQLSDYI